MKYAGMEPKIYGNTVDGDVPIKDMAVGDFEVGGVIRLTDDAPPQLETISFSIIDCVFIGTYDFKQDHMVVMRPTKIMIHDLIMCPVGSKEAGLILPLVMRLDSAWRRATSWLARRLLQLAGAGVTWGLRGRR